MSTRRKTVLAILLVPMAVLLTLTSVSLASARPAGTLASHSIDAHKKPRIKILSFTFTVPAHVRAGAKIKVVNQDGFLHSVTSDDGTSFTVDVPGSSAVVFTAPSTPGKYPFHCRIHPTMKGTLVVR